jgi:ABC-type cobalamin transport system permease subunit
MNTGRGVNCPMSICLAIAGLLLFIALWLVPFPSWVESTSRGLIVSVCYFSICPVLMILSIGFSVRDLFRKRCRIQASVAICISAAILGWYWLRPPQ